MMCVVQGVRYACDSRFRIVELYSGWRPRGRRTTARDEARKETGDQALEAAVGAADAVAAGAAAARIVLVLSGQCCGQWRQGAGCGGDVVVDARERQTAGGG